MKNIAKTMLNTSIVFLLSASISQAQAELSKEQIKDKAVEVCQMEAQKRYGADSIKSIADKAKWKNGLGGATVKVKVKPKSKRTSKYLCVVKQDETVTFYKN